MEFNKLLSSSKHQCPFWKMKTSLSSSETSRSTDGSVNASLNIFPAHFVIRSNLSICISLMKIFIVSWTVLLCNDQQSEVTARYVTPLMFNSLWSSPLPDTKTNSVGWSQMVPVKRLKESQSVWIRVGQIQREGSSVMPDMSFSGLQERATHPICFDSEKNLSIWDVRLISECWGQRRSEIKI